VCAVLTLALGIGAAATVHGVLRGFQRPLPVPSGESVVQVRAVERSSGRAIPASSDALDRWAGGVSSLEGVGAFRTLSPTVTGDGPPPFRAQAAELSAEVLGLLRERPALGRLPRAVREGEPLELLLGHGVWTNVFGADPAVLGTELFVDGRPGWVVGVMPERFGFPFSQSFWWASAELGRMPPGRGVAGGEVELVGRLTAGMTTATAAAQLTTRLENVQRGNEGLPGSAAASTEAGQATVVVSGFTADRGESGEVVGLRALLFLVLLLVLVSCANVANLLLTRAAERAHLFTIHRALGAGPGQMAVQVFGEAFLLALSGGVAGLVGGAFAARWIETTLSGNWGYHWMRVGVDGQVALFTLGLVLLVTFVAGTAPALQGLRLDIATTLRATRSGSRSGGWASSVLLSSQVAFSAAALVIAVLIAVGALRVMAQGSGLPRDELLLTTVTLDDDRYGEAASRTVFRASLLDALGRIGASDVLLTTGIPGFRADPSGLELDDGDAREGQPLATGVFAVTPSFFLAFELVAVRGRLIEEGDATAPEPPAVLSAAFARRHFAGADAIGRRIRLAASRDPQRWFRVVGVAEDVFPEAGTRQDWVYVPIEQWDPRTFFVGVLSNGTDAVAFMTALLETIRSVDPELAVDGSFLGTAGFTLGQILDYILRLYSTTGLLSAVGAIGAVLVALVGVFGVLSLEIRRRMREMGIRMAIGEGRGAVVRRILKRGLVRVAPGLAIGLLLAWLVAPVYGRFFGTAQGRDPRVFAFALGVYMLATLAAAGLPAMRAASVDPAIVLRDE
jgi:predicted permease